MADSPTHADLPPADQDPAVGLPPPPADPQGVRPDAPPGPIPPPFRMTREQEERERREWQGMAGAGIEFAVAIGLFTLIGFGLDRWLATRPWLMIVGLMLGFAIGLYQLLRAANRSNL